jgi:lysophospholipase L1-like esterase
MKLQKGDKLVFIGDSITDCGRTQPVGEGREAFLGNGYVLYVEALLTAKYPETPINVVNVGTSGHQVTDLRDRWDRDVLDQRPDWLSIMIGTNDVWRQFDTYRLPERGVEVGVYEETLCELVCRVRPELKGLVMMTPFYLDRNGEDPMRKTMDAYGRVVRKIAEDHDAIFVDTQAMFNRLMEHVPTQYIAGDRVHPNPCGHMALARAFLQAVDVAV